MSSLLVLAIAVSTITVFVQNRRSADVEYLDVEKQMKMLSRVVKDVDQLRQVEIIQAQALQRQSLSDAQVETLLSVVNGRLDPILQAEAEASLLEAQRKGCLSDSQKRNVALKNIGALNHPLLAVRQFAISLAGELGEKSSVPALLPFLNAPEPKVRRLTKKALERLQG